MRRTLNYEQASQVECAPTLLAKHESVQCSVIVYILDPDFEIEPTKGLSLQPGLKK